MLQHKHGDITLLRFERLSREPGLIHAFTTKPQNYAPHRGVDSALAVEYRRRVCGLLGLSFDQLTSPAQVHCGEVLNVEPGDVGRGRDGRATAVPFVDGLITDKPGVPLVLMSADCPLVMAYDPQRPAVGAAHASWQGSMARITEQMIRQMVRQFGSDPAKLLCAIAPSAGSCCYEVGEEVRRIGRTKLDDPEACFVERGGKLYLDLWTANRQQLIANGVRPENIEVAGLCSICDERFWSHRRDKETAGRSALFLGLR